MRLLLTIRIYLNVVTEKCVMAVGVQLERLLS